MPSGFESRTRRYRCTMALPQGVDVGVLRQLERHEALVHTLPGRELRELGDGVMLFDPHDREPFWNRLAALSWPSDGRAFQGRLDQAITLFATLDRLPHIWARPALNEPPDLVDRLVGEGFEVAGEGHLMVLVDRGRPRRAIELDGRADPDTTVHWFSEVSGFDATEAAIDVATVLNESFRVEAGRQASIELETEVMLGRPELETVLVRVAGEPAATARVATIDGVSYLASIGTRPRYQGRGLGRLVTALVTVRALDFGSRWIHLGVFAENVNAIRMYEGLGFERVGGAAADLILR
jgi:GNAT superfamily N-acetyltransferase